ncbi:MAG: cbb3-type cytochrome c oxidase subunit I [Candidatus Eisenbacteria bacterium]|nr:cbb3-type cytochrome c oxidase subunit I [Candidatus Eisenbacteria bacterium]
MNPEQTFDSSRGRSAVSLWLITTCVLFAVMVILGFLMRSGQSGVLALDPQLFYAIMTLHGLGMAGVLFTGGLAMLWLLVSRYAPPSLRVLNTSYVLIVLGVVGLVVATLVGRFGPGWYLLYPLPFAASGWPHWSIGLATASLMILGVGWLLTQLDILRVIARRYGPAGMLGWTRAGEPETPPTVMIAAVVTVAGSLTTVVGAAVFFLYLLKWFNPSVEYDALLLKNMVFLFGHTIVNVTMYMGVAAVYELLPEFTGRPWKNNRITTLSWNVTLLFVLTAYFHHIYMDFAQPFALQIVGQVTSYLSSVPATAVTIFGVIGQVYRGSNRWSFTPLAMTAGIVGWVVGGFAAVADSTIAINRVLHNTLWVPGHFHTYFLVGYVLMLLGFAHHLYRSHAEKLAAASLGLMLLGGYGLVTSFYLGGANSVPRRYASYDMIPMSSLALTGKHLALLGAISALTFLIGVLTFYVSLMKGRRAAGQ